MMKYYVYSSYGAEIGRFDTLEEAMQLANREGNCEVQDDGSDEVIYSTVEQDQ